MHGLGGSEETWGEFPTLIKEDELFFKGVDTDLFTYDTSLIELSSAGGVLSKGLSALFPQSLLSWASKLLPVVLPKLPKIQKVSDLLKGHITLKCKQYDEIYLVAHSMGGLVVRQYLHDMILSEDSTLKVKKLMLYAVPNNGSSLAKVSALYGHTQIGQLDTNSDFLSQLNQAINYVDLKDNKIEVKYVVGIKDIAVDEASAIGEHSNRKFSILLDKTHFSIVKPIDKDDEAYLVLQEFLGEHKELVQVDEQKELSIPKDVINNPFIENISQKLKRKKLLTLFSQDFTEVSTQQALVKQKMHFLFKENFYHLLIPQSIEDEATYFSFLAENCHLRGSVNSVHTWSRELTKLLEEQSTQELCLYITGIENGNEKLNLEFARSIRGLQDEHSNLYVIFVGRKKLASLVYGKNSKLSPLNSSEKLFFDNAEESIGHDDIRQELESLKANGESATMYLDDEVEVNWIYYSESILNTLFWRNIMLNVNGKYVWRDEATKEIAKEVFGCK